MGMTWHLHTRNGPAVEGDGADCSWVYRLAALLDGCCRRLDLPPLTSFQDFTDIAAAIGDDEGIGADPPSPEGAQWFAAADGLRVLEGLADHLDGLGSVPGIPTDRQDELFDELNGCIARLEAVGSGGQFHLAVLL